MNNRERIKSLTDEEFIKEFPFCPDPVKGCNQKETCPVCRMKWMEEEVKKHHELKILPEYFQEVLEGIKTFEYRLNDRDYKQGDYVILREWDGKRSVEGTYTGREIKALIGYVLPVNTSYCVFSLMKVGENKKANWTE